MEDYNYFDYMKTPKHGEYVLNKHRAMNNLIRSILNKTNQMFEYENLPDSIPVRILETMLQSNGNVLWHEVEGTLYVFTGGLGGLPDVYYEPTLYTIANPALKYNKAVKLGTEGILMRNDGQMMGLLPLLYKHGSLLAEADISFRSSIINTRVVNTMSAGDDKTYQSAKKFFEKVEDGEHAVILEEQLLDGLKVHPSSVNNHSLSELRETYQFIKAAMYSELGLKLAHNMKREYVSAEEITVDDDSLLPLIENMLTSRKEALEQVNEMFGTNIKVELKGTWELQAIELEQTIEATEDIIGGNENDDETTESDERDDESDIEGIEEDDSEPEEHSEGDEDSTGETGTIEIEQDEVIVKVEVIIENEEERDEEDEIEDED